MHLSLPESCRSGTRLHHVTSLRLSGWGRGHLSPNRRTAPTPLSVLQDELWSHPGSFAGCDGCSRDPWPVPLRFPRSLNNSTGHHMVFIFQGTKCLAGTILFILSVSPSAGELLSVSEAFSSRASSPKVQVAHQSCAVCGCPRGHCPEIWVAGGSAFSEKPQWPPVSLGSWKAGFLSPSLPPTAAPALAARMPPRFDAVRSAFLPRCTK